MEKDANKTHHNKEKEKSIKLSGNFLYYDQENLNGRIYKKQIAEEIIEQFNKMQEQGPCFGELGYPMEGGYNGVNLSRVSHEIEEIHLDEENKSLAGTIKILDTPKGNIVKEMLKSGPLGISCRSRGTGSVNENGEIEDFQILSFDLISGPDAFSNIKEDDYITLFEDE